MLKPLGHLLLATLLTANMGNVVQAELIETEKPARSTEADPIEALELIKEEESVTIASRYEQPISQAPSNVYVITDEDIRHSGAADLPTVLRRVPGLEVMQTTGADFNVSVRADNQLFANKLLVMIDGRSIYLDGQGLVFWKAIPIALPEIKRIEVLKGPASVLYGFNAFDGVINIITKSAQEMKGTTLQFGGGELGTLTSSAVHAGQAGALDYRISLGQDQHAQWRQHDGLAYRANRLNAQTQYILPNNGKLRVAGGMTDVNRFDGPVSNVQIPATRITQPYADVHYEQGAFSVRGWWTRGDLPTQSVTHPVLAPFLKQTNTRGGLDIAFLSETYNVEMQHGLEFGPTNTLTYGANYRYNGLSGNGVALFDHEDRLGFYLQDEWRLLPALTATAGVRHDLHSQIHSTWSPRAALIASLAPGHTLRLSASVAYRPPTLWEKNLALRFAPTSPPLFAPFPLIGSQTLEPERIVSYEAGYQGWWLKHRLRSRLDVFYNHLSDLISFATVGNTRTLTNGGTADIYGMEGGAEFLMTPWLSGYANVSYQQVRQSFTGVAQRGRPALKANAGLRGEWENGLNGEASVSYIASATYPLIELMTAFKPAGAAVPNSTVDSYTLLNLRIGYKFWQQQAAAGYQRDAEVAVSAFNALNDKHKEHPLGDTIGSRVMGWLTVRF